jgi:hypothetical protein
MQLSGPTAFTPLLYKFYSPRTITALREQTLAFTPPNHFNDPFELLPKIIRDTRARKLWQKSGTFTKERREKLRREYNLEHGTNFTKAQFKRLVEQHKDEIAVQVPIAFEDFPKRMANKMIEIVSKDFGVACFSKGWSHPLMWGHYSSGFKGFCVGYDMPLDTDFSGLSRVEVEYSMDRYPLSEANVLEGEVSREIVDGIVRTKSVHWAYEEEVRFIMDASSPALTPNPDRTQFYLKHLSNAVHEIIIGMRCEEEDRKVLRELRDDKYPHAELYETVPGGSTFEVVRRLLI